MGYSAVAKRSAPVEVAEGEPLAVLSNCQHGGEQRTIVRGRSSNDMRRRGVRLEKNGEGMSIAALPGPRLGIEKGRVTHHEKAYSCKECANRAAIDVVPPLRTQILR